MTEPRIMVDATPGAHSFLDALAVVSFRLGCGCRTRPGRPEDADCSPLALRNVGNTYPCSKHGDQVITRATTRLVGWKT